MVKTNFVSRVKKEHNGFKIYIPQNNADYLKLKKDDLVKVEIDK